jgi:hypothetical protein
MKIAIASMVCAGLLAACTTRTNNQDTAKADSLKRLQDSISSAVQAVEEDPGPPMTSADFVGIYLLDGNASDNSPNVNNGEVNNVTFVADRNGEDSSAGAFDGSSWISVALQKPATVPIAFAVSAWFKTSDKGEKMQTILSLGRSAEGSGFNFGCQRSGGHGSVYFGIMGANGPIVATGDYDADGQWHYLLGSYDGKSVTIFLDGKLVGKAALTPEDDEAFRSILETTNQPVEIGRELEGLDRYFNGYLDEVGIVGHAVTESWLRKYFN